MTTSNRGKVISFVNMKGGVGKTTLTVNIGNYLVEQGNKVLIIDFDPQFNATQTLLLHKSMLLKEEDDDNKDKELSELVKSSEIFKQLSEEKKTVLQLFENTDVSSKNADLIYNIKYNFDLIPGDLALAKEVSGDTASKLNCLIDYINNNKIHQSYEYILIDCPPTWSILTHASLYASDYYVIPSQLDLYSSIGISLLEDQIEEKLINTSNYKSIVFQRQHEGTGDEIKRLGIVFTLIDNRLRKLEIEKSLRKQFKEFNFIETKVPFIPSVTSELVLYSDGKNQDNFKQLYNSIEKITLELISKIEEIENRRGCDKIE